jgi:hypothetical protein
MSAPHEDGNYSIEEQHGHCDLVEQMARAMFANSPLYRTVRWNEVHQMTRDMWLADARVALRVVREVLAEPSEKMVDSGDDMRQQNLATCEVWRAMLAASALGRIEE